MTTKTLKWTKQQTICTDKQLVGIPIYANDNDVIIPIGIDMHAFRTRPKWNNSGKIIFDFVLIIMDFVVYKYF